MLKCLWTREQQCHSARKIKNLRGKINTGNTTIVTVPGANGEWMDLTNQEDVESTIMKNNEEKFPFLHFFLASEFGFKGLTTAAQAALAGKKNLMLPSSPVLFHHESGSY